MYYGRFFFPVVSPAKLYNNWVVPSWKLCMLVVVAITTFVSCENNY
jgi:hypothetical protein